MIGATLVSLALALTGIAPRAWILASALWALYGLIMGLINGVLDPFLEFVGRLLSDVGLRRVGDGLSDVEALVAQGEYAFAATRYQERAKDPGIATEATVRRAALLTGPLRQPAQAVAELEALREAPGQRLSAGDDMMIGLAIADIAEHRLSDPARAMFELRRLLDRYPHSHHTRRLRGMLASLRAERFGGGFAADL